MRDMRLRLLPLLLMVAAAWTPAAQAKRLPPPGLVAVSAGEQVVVVEPVSGGVRSFQTGTVGKLFPAPGGVLFAPDLVHGRTTVIDLRRLTVRQTLKGVTMPHFGQRPDRYVVVAGDVLLVSYPDRAVLGRVEAEILHPWQVVTSADGTTVLILERLPGSADPPVLWGANLIERRLSLRAPLPADTVSMAFTREHGLLALAGGGAIRLVDPATVTTVARMPVAGGAVDVGFADKGERVLVAVRRVDGSGVVQRFRIKGGRHGVKAREEGSIALSGAPAALAVSPGGQWAAVALAGGGVAILDARKGRPVREIVTPEAPRDLVWCDPSRPGPLLPDWSLGPQGKPPGPSRTPVR